MTRAALLPAGSDPYLLAYWLRHYKAWAGSVDELHIAVCGVLAPDVLAYIEAIIDDAGGILYHLPRTAHGVVLEYLVSKTQADYLLLCEDDAFIRKPGEVAEAFGAIESGTVDVIATPRDSFATKEVVQAAQKRFGEDATAFWPCFLFVSRENLLKTDGDYSGTIWEAGDTVPSLNHVCLAENCADTFVSASWQLRDLGLRVELRDNHRVVGPVDWVDPPWFHVGSLSSGYGYMWMGNMKPKVYVQQIGILQTILDDAYNRMSWWQRAWSCWDGSIPEHHAAYEAGFRRLMDDVGLTQEGVDATRQAFDRLVTWAER